MEALLSLPREVDFRSKVHIYSNKSFKILAKDKSRLHSQRNWRLILEMLATIHLKNPLFSHLLPKNIKNNNIYKTNFCCFV
jgi:hypothetical protein